MANLIDAVTADKIKMWLMGLNIRPSYNWEDVETAMSDYGKPPFHVHISDGASKICLVFEKLDFVIKWSTEGESEAMQEVNYYEEAKAQNLDKFFPMTEYFFSHNEVDFVVQEKVTVQAGEVYGEYMEHLSHIGRTVSMQMINKVEKDLNKVSGYTRRINRIWIACLLSIYGKKATKALCKFVQEHDINDLHGSNVGFKGNRPIILDFSGYHRND